MCWDGQIWRAPSTVLYFIVLYCIVLYYIVLLYIVLYWHLAGEEPHSDGQLVDRAQPAAEVEGGNLGYVHRHQGGVQTTVHT